MIIPVWLLLLLVVIVLVNGGAMLIAGMIALSCAGVAGFLLGWVFGYAHALKKHRQTEPPSRPKPPPQPRTTLANHWKVLGLKPSASEDEINDRYRELAQQFHPDVMGGSERTMTRLNVARDLARREARQRRS